MVQLLGGFAGGQVAGGEYGYGEYSVPDTTGASAFLTGPYPLGLSNNYGAVSIGEGGAERASIAEQLRLAEAAKLAGGAIEYISDIPGEIGEAGGEFVAELGAGVGTGVESVLTSVTEPITAIPGDLFEGIPSWVPLLGAAYLLTRQ